MMGLELTYVSKKKKSPGDKLFSGPISLEFCGALTRQTLAHNEL